MPTGVLTDYQQAQRRVALQRLIAQLPMQPPGATIKELASMTGLSERRLRTHLVRLVASGKVVRWKTRNDLENRALGVRYDPRDDELIPALPSKQIRYYLKGKTTHDER